MQNLQLNKKIKPLVPKYSLSQGIRVALTYLKKTHPKESFEELYARLKFKGNPSLSFAKTELHEMVFIDTPKGKCVEITLNFLGLFGATSPLPSHYCEMVLESAGDDKRLNDFLNLFNHHIQKIIFLVWKKQRYYIQYEQNLQDKFSKYMLSLLGMYSQTQIQSSTLNFQKILPYIGILSMKQKSASSLVSVLRHYFEHDNLDIIQCIPMKSKIPSWQLPSLGDQNCKLGTNMLIGESVMTKGAKFQILFKDIAWNELYEYSSLGKKMKELRELISLALYEPFEYEICLEINKEKIEPLQLSSRRLGINGFLGSSPKNKRIILSS